MKTLLNSSVIHYVLIFLAFDAYSQKTAPLQKLSASDKEASANFGWSSAIYEDYAIVGAPFKKKTFNKKSLLNAGAAYIYKRDNTTGTWQQTQKLETKDSLSYQWFGTSVSIFGDYAIVGANGNDGTTVKNGKAYIYENNYGTWSLVQELSAPNQTNVSHHFGENVCISDKYAVVAAPNKGHDISTLFNVPSYGAVFVYLKNPSGEWKQIAELLPENRHHDFGKSIALYDNYILVGANDPAVAIIYKIGPSKPVIASKIPKKTKSTKTATPSKNKPAEVFKPNDVVRIAELKPDKEMNEAFARSIAMYGDNIIIGVTGRSGRDAGVAYIYSKYNGEWIFNQKLLPKELKKGDNFGHTLALYDSIAVIGAYGDKWDGFSSSDSTTNNETNRYNLNSKENLNPKDNSNAGAAYVFKKNRSNMWVEDTKLTGSPRKKYQNFGYSVGVYKKEVIIGSRLDSTGVKENAGSIYFYHFSKKPSSNP